MAIRDRTFYRVALATAFVLYGSTFFWLTDGWLPGLLGLVLLPVIVWAVDSLGFVEYLRDRPGTRIRPRQYLLLRSKVGSLLEIIRRMNWVAVDMRRGVRTVAEVEEELDKAVERMKALVDEIRAVAGKAEEFDAEVPAAELRVG
jgi:hypothetical protein